MTIIKFLLFAQYFCGAENLNNYFALNEIFPTKGPSGQNFLHVYCAKLNGYNMTFDYNASIKVSALLIIIWLLSIDSALATVQ